MTIIYLHQYFKLPSESGGTRSYDLAVSFTKKGHSVIVVTSTSDRKYKNTNGWNVEKLNNIEIHKKYLPYSNQLSNFDRAIVFLKFLIFSSLYILKLKGDLVLATSTPLTIGIPALIKKWVSRTPFIFEVRDVWPEAVIAIGAIKNKPLQYILFSLEKLIYNNAAAIVPLSSDMQNSIVSRYPYVAKKTSIVIENISEISRFREIDTKIDFEKLIGFHPRFTVLYAGTFGKVNGIHKIVELAEKTINKDSGIVYFLIGSGAEKEKVKQLASRKGILNKNIFLFDPVSKNELPIWYNSVSMGSSFVIGVPELWANSANKFFDTLAASKPILINHQGWQAEVIRSKNVGYVLPCTITDNDAFDFVKYSKNSDIISNQGKNAYSLAKEKYSLELASNKYISIFRSIKM